MNRASPSRNDIHGSVINSTAVPMMTETLMKTFDRFLVNQLVSIKHRFEIRSETFHTEISTCFFLCVPFYCPQSDFSMKIEPNPLDFRHTLTANY